jgi:hypothetical protein
MRVGTATLVHSYTLQFNIDDIIDQVSIFFMVGTICRVCSHVDGNDMYPRKDETAMESYYKVTYLERTAHLIKTSSC